MIKSPVSRLSDVARQLLPGQRFMFDQPDGRSFAAVWPNPRWPQPDDHLEPHQRAASWADGLDQRGKSRLFCTHGTAVQLPVC